MALNDYEHTLSFSLNKRFFKDINKANCFSLNSMNQGESEDGDVYSLLLCSSLPDNVYDCVFDESDVGKVAGTLKSPSQVAGWNTLIIEEEIPDLQLYVEFINEGEAGFIIHIANNSDIQINLGDEEDLVLKGIIIYNTRTNYMLSFSRLSSPIHIKNFITIPIDSDLGGVGVCNAQVNQ